MNEKLFEDLKRQPFHVIAKSRIPSLQRNGEEWIGLCPFHKEKTPSFTIYRNRDRIYLFKCHGCGVAGNVIQFVQRLDKVGVEQAIEKIKKESDWFEGKEIVEKTFSTPLPGRNDFVKFPLSKMDSLKTALLESKEAVAWLENRGIKIYTALSLNWGFLPSLELVCPNHVWVKNGWIAIPTIQGDEIVSMKYRSIMGKKTPDGKAAIRRLPDMITCLYNLQSVRENEDTFLVEGEPDCAVMTQAGYNAVALPSAEYVPTPEERDILMKSRNLFLAGDSDDVGSKAMHKLWAELRDGVFMVEWPEGCKDANDVLSKHCGGDEEKFIQTVENVKEKSSEKPIPDFYDLSKILRNINFVNPMENPTRLHLRDPNVDRMAITLPGNIVSVFATYTGSGKTSWILDQFELDEAIKYGRIVINYSAELSPEEFGRLAAANILQKNRLELTKEDFDAASVELANARFYVGYNPDLTDPDSVLDAIEIAIRRLGADIVVLDHLHFYTRGENDVKQQARAMQRMKNIARKQGVIFVVVGQSRKKQPNQKGKPSEGSDAKGSETFLSDASTCYHIHRDLRKDVDFARPETWPSDLLDTTTDIRLAKVRCKGPGKAVARQQFRGEFGRFYPFTTQEQ